MPLWTPAELGSKLRLWLKGDELTEANGVAIASWTDASGNGFHATGATNKPTAVAAGLNGLKVARFTAASQQYFALAAAIFSGNSEGAEFHVAKALNDPTTQVARSGPVFGDVGTSTNNFYPYINSRIYSDFLSTARKDFLPTRRINVWHIGSIRSKANDWRLDLDGVNEHTTAANSVGASSAPLLGADEASGSWYYFDGDVAEALYCNSFLTTDEKQRIEGYLAWKWGLVANLAADHPWKAAAPTTEDGITGAASIAEAGDALGSASRIAIAAALAGVEADDGVAASAALRVAGSAAIAEAGDSIAATGVSGDAPIEGVAGVGEAADLVVATATLAIASAAANVEADDGAAASAALLVAAAANCNEADDLAIASAALRIVGGLDLDEAGDVVAATGGVPVALLDPGVRRRTFSASRREAVFR